MRMPSHRSRLLATHALLFLLCVGCAETTNPAALGAAGDRDGDPEVRKPSGIDAGAAPTSSLRDDLPAELVRKIEDVSDPQLARPLADLWISNQELQEAFEATMACTHAEYPSVTGSHDGVGGLSFSSTGDSVSEVEEQDAAVDRCLAQHFELPAAIHSEHNSPTATERATSMELFTVCAAEEGFRGPTADDVAEQAEEEQRELPERCLQEMDEYLIDVVSRRADAGPPG